MNDFIKHLSDENAEIVNSLQNEDSLPLKVDPLYESLSQDQKNALDKVLIWLNTHKGCRDENGFFALTGSAGTGKTTLVNVILKMLPKLYRDSRVCICAPTHKAKKVIQEKTKWRNSETLQALLGLKLDINLEDFDANNPAFSMIGDRKIRDYDLVIGDEASMINTDLKTTIEEACKSTGTLFLYIGDTKQLNPVKEYTISPALTTPIHNYNLTQVVRQDKGNPLIILLDTLRADIEANTSNYIDLIAQKPESMNEKGEGYHAINDPRQYADKMSNVFTGEAFKINKNHCRHISWTNDSITKTSAWLRKDVFKFNNTLEQGEILLSYKTIVEDEETVIVNSDDYIVESMKDSIISEYTYPLHVHVVKLRGIDTGQNTTVNILIRNQQNYDNYKAVYNEKVSKARAQRGAAWKAFFRFKENVLVVENMNYTNQFGGGELIKKDIDYGYGITAHKSQGSTYHTVFVNYKDISKIVTYERNDKKSAELMKKRLLYVALSRASNEAYLFY